MHNQPHNPNIPPQYQYMPQPQMMGTAPMQIPDMGMYASQGFMTQDNQMMPPQIPMAPYQMPTMQPTGPVLVTMQVAKDFLNIVEQGNLMEIQRMICISIYLLIWYSTI